MAQYKNIDIIPDSTVNRIYLSQGDIGRTLIFYLFENALSWSVPASSTIKCQGTKPSGFGFSVSCTYSGNTVTCVTTEEMTDEFGQIEAELVITSSDESQVFGTSNFILDIEKNPHPVSTEDGGADTAIALTARVTALESAVSELEASEGLTDDIKQALLQIAQKVAYIDDDGQDYYDALYNALYPPVELASITCVYTQSATVYPTTSLDSLKSDLVVTAHMTDSSTSVVSSSSYALSGTLSAGTSTITVTYGGKTTTFTVTVTALPTLSSISAVYTQSGTVYDTDSLDSLKSDLVVTAHYDDSSTQTVSAYTLSGTLTTGTSTITVTHGGKTTTFNVTVSGSTGTYRSLNVLTDMLPYGNADAYTSSVEDSTYGTIHYCSASSTRTSYPFFDLLIDPDCTYTFTLDGDGTTKIAVIAYSDDVVTQIENQASVSAAKSDSGWQSSGYTLTPDGTHKYCMRITLDKKPSALTSAGVTTLTITYSRSV